MITLMLLRGWATVIATSVCRLATRFPRKMILWKWGNRLKYTVWICPALSQCLNIVIIRAAIMNRLDILINKAAPGGTKALLSFYHILMSQRRKPINLLSCKTLKSFERSYQLFTGTTRINSVHPPIKNMPGYLAMTRTGIWNRASAKLSQISLVLIVSW